MTIPLAFNEIEIRDIYEEQIDNSNQNFNSKIKNRNKSSLLLLVISIGSFGLIIFHEDWFIIGRFFLIVTIVYSLWTLYLKFNYSREIKKILTDINKWINRYNNIKKIYYTLSDDIIQYYENDQLITEFSYSNIKSTTEDDHGFLILFQNSERIWIPKVTVTPEDYIRLINKVRENENAR